MITAARLQELIASWSHEAAVARASLRQDDYAARCQQTVEALRELEQWQQFQWPPWQSMETAPKDGTEVLVWVEPCQMWTFGRMLCARWIGEYSMWSIPGISGLSPTHWMHLPGEPCPPCNERENRREGEQR